ncbi:MAG: hypothetical protein A2Z97_12635 [Bdellovibrionales bacterium GWB1_52_6]|nr:MAG: hypothetical protein A2Z97_12635 [Bdellovibrionales bacterium GWB1_52_6]OFZ04168.1 MAG: hypothetical protein A2X97_15335 [Bdellovibrionales bacterium GWA1_52_35]HCM40511.1 hypothetical protein [Bdellovibrionales bacterium]
MRKSWATLVLISILITGTSVPAFANSFAPDQLKLECPSSSRETEILLLKRQYFAGERRETAAELAQTLGELKSGAKKRAYWMTAGAAIALSALTYEGMSLLADQATTATFATLKKAGIWATGKLHNGSLIKLLVADGAYNAGKIVMAEKIAGVLGPKQVNWIRKMGYDSPTDLLPGFLEFSPTGIQRAYERIGFEHAQLEIYERAATPAPRDSRKVSALGWDDFIDFKTLFEIADAKRRMYDLEVRLTERLLQQLRARCKEVSGEALVLRTERPSLSSASGGPVSTLLLRYPAISEQKAKSFFSNPEPEAPGRSRTTSSARQ